MNNLKELNDIMDQIVGISKEERTAKNKVEKLREELRREKKMRIHYENEIRRIKNNSVV